MIEPASLERQTIGNPLLYLNGDQRQNHQLAIVAIGNCTNCHLSHCCDFAKTNASKANKIFLFFLFHVCKIISSLPSFLVTTNEHEENFGNVITQLLNKYVFKVGSLFLYTCVQIKE